MGNSNSRTYNVTMQKPAGVRYISETSAKITLSLGEEKQKTLNISAITNKNLDNNLSVNLTDASAIAVQVKGVEEVINNITEENISAYVDLAGYSVGDYEVDLKIDSDDPRVTFVVTSKVKIKIGEKE